MDEQTRLLLADDHAGVRSMLRADLEDAGFVVCAEAADADEAVHAAERERPDLCLLDVRMPGNGLVAAWDITARLPTTKVVMLTVSRSEEHEVAAFRAGAVGYVLKDVDGARLAAAVRAFVRGEVTITPRAASGLIELQRQRSNGRRRGRTALRTASGDVLELLSGGRSLADAAAELGMSGADAGAEVAAVLARVRMDREALASLVI